MMKPSGSGGQRGSEGSAAAVGNAQGSSSANSVAGGAQGGASSVEVYGFVGWITSAVAFALYVLWAALPEGRLHQLGITYYPSKHWALAIPLWLMLAVIYVYWAYEGMNAMAVPPIDSLTNIQDPRSKWPSDLGRLSAMGDTQRSIPPLMHVPPPVVSRVLYGGQSVRDAEAAEALQAGAPITTTPARRHGRH